MAETLIWGRLKRGSITPRASTARRCSESSSCPPLLPPQVATIVRHRFDHPRSRHESTYSLWHVIQFYLTIAAPILSKVSFEPRRALTAELRTAFTSTRGLLQPPAMAFLILNKYSEINGACPKRLVFERSCCELRRGS